MGYFLREYFSIKIYKTDFVFILGERNEFISNVSLL